KDCPVHASLRDGVVYRVNDEVFWRKDGTSFPVEYISTPIREDDRVVGVVMVFRDTTDRKKAESALRASEERLELVIRGSNDGFWDGQVLPGKPWNSPDTPIWWSSRVREMLGYTEEEFPDVLKSWASRLHPEDRERVFAALTAHIERRVPYDEEYRLLTKQGDYHWVRARGQAIWDAVGRMIRMAGSLQSIMDRKRTEEAIRRSQQLLQEVADTTTAVIYAKDPDGRFLFVNRRFEELFNLTADQIIGHTNHEIFPRKIADAFRANDIEVFEKNATVEYEEQAPHQDGLHTYLSIKFPLRGQDGSPYAVCGVSSDITERKLAEDALRTHEAQLRHALTSAEVGGWDWDRQTGQFCWSRQVDTMLGLSDGSRARSREDWLALVHPDDRQAMAQALDEALEQGGQDVLFEHRTVTTDGSVRWLVWSGQVLRNREGKVVHMLGMVRSLSARPRKTREK
ncbi:MAG TPA: PAS domain-containing protein, partial [Nitrospira sp.]|nr:PAS domain-containing protein [Nitrospira sp.]